MANNKWTPEMNQEVKDNFHLGFDWLMKRFGVTNLAIKKKCSLLGLHKRLPKDQTRKPDNSEKFTHGRHCILNSSTEGKIPVWVPSERMTIYCAPVSDVQAVVEKFINRHKNIEKW